MTKRSSSRLAAPDDIRRLVSSWGGFERLVAQLSSTGDVEVEHNVVLTGKSGTPRQIDVLLKHISGLYEHRILVECKYWNRRVSRLHVDALITSVNDLNASRGVIFSTVGFQAGAIAQARQSGIDLFTVRFPTDREWGLPGRHLNMILQVVSCSIGSLNMPGSLLSGVAHSTVFDLKLDPEGVEQTKTNILSPLGAVDYPETLELLLLNSVRQAAHQLWPPVEISTTEEVKIVVRKFWRFATLEPPIPIFVPQPHGAFILPKCKFQVGMKIWQTQIKIDRADKYAFVLAIDDHVRKIRKSVSKVATDPTKIVPFEEQEVDPTKGPPFVNGSVLCAHTTAFFPFNEVADLQEGEIQDTQE